MTIADNLTALAEQKLGYQDSVEACKVSLANKNVVVPAGSKLADISGLIDEIQQGGIGDWIRPADWLPIENLVVDGEQKTVGLYAVYPNVNDKGMTNTVAFVVTGNYTVDWGDGVVENFNSNVQAQHIYNYDSLSSSTDCTRGYRQAIITITPKSGQNITQLFFGRKHSSVVFGRISSQWLDLVIGGTAISYFRMQDNNIVPNLLEKVKVIQSNAACTNMINMFSNCYSLQSLDLSSFNTSLVTNMNAMFNNCNSLQSLDLSATLLSAVSSAANFAGFTSGTISLIKCRLPQVKWAFSVASNPLSATALNELFTDLFDLTALATQAITITGCLGAATCNKTIATNKNWTVIG